MLTRISIYSLRSVVGQIRGSRISNIHNLNRFQNCQRGLHILSGHPSTVGIRRILPNFQNALLIRFESSSSAGVKYATIETQTESPESILQHQSTATTSSTGVGIPSTQETFDSVASVGNIEIIEKNPIKIIDIPEPPPIPEAAETIQVALNALGEPTLQSIGLGSWWPAGIAQQMLEFFHANLGLPWWAAIFTGTVLIRLCLLPLVIKSQKNAAKMQNAMPQMQALQLKMSEARQSGNALMAAKYGQELMIFMKEKDVSPFKNLIVPFAMMPFFLSFFFGLRAMANYPVESMKAGGLFWFTDLTLADPYYLLPIIVSTTLLVTIEVGADGARLSTNQSGQIAKYILRSLPFIMFPFIINFPAGILCYWASTNLVSLVQVSILRVPAVRDYFGIERLRKIDPATLPMAQFAKKGFVENVKDSYKNLKITNELENREHYDEMNFKRAGKGPIPRTFKYDPTKIQAKSK